MKNRRRLHNHRRLKARRRALRNQGTPTEGALWRMLRQSQLRGRKFRRQHSIGRYILDFYCPAERLAVELDGAAHDDPARHAYDTERTRALAAHDVRVVRIANEEVFRQPDVVLDRIAACFGDA
jgi:very-short-patch-repair endonuclease